MYKTVVVVAIHRIGNGVYFFYDIKRVKKNKQYKSKLFYETSISLDIAIKLSEMLEKEGIDFGISIHVDAGKMVKHLN